MDINLAKKLYIDERLPMPEVAKRLGLSYTTVHYQLEKAGFIRSSSEATKLAIATGRRSFRRKLESEKVLSQIKKAYLTDELSVRRLAERYEVAHSTMVKALKRLGCQILSPSKSRIKQFNLGRFKMPTGESHPRWKGGVYRSKYGYLYRRVPGHPKANNSGYVPEHILAWEKAHGCSVPKGHLVHHINGVKDDNRSENLVAILPNKHSKTTLLEIVQKRVRELETLIATKQHEPEDFVG